MKEKSLPRRFKYLFWWLNWQRFSPSAPKGNKELIVLQVLNYGDQKHLEWIIKNIGEEKIKKIIKDKAQSEFNVKGLETIQKVFKIKKFRWKTRGEKVHFLIHRDEKYKDILKIIDSKFKNEVGKIKIQKIKI